MQTATTTEQQPNMLNERARTINFLEVAKDRYPNFDRLSYTCQVNIVDKIREEHFKMYQ
jgi:hypothetical protein